MLDLTNLLNFFCWIALFDARIMLLLLRNNEETRRSLKPVGTRPGIMYGLCKVHKDIIDNCPPFRPILSAINIPTYKTEIEKRNKLRQESGLLQS